MKAGAATTDGDLSSAVGIAFDPILVVHVDHGSPVRPVRGGVRGHAHARAWPGCNIDRGPGEAEVTVGRIVDEDLFALVR